jgi:serine/threonine protein kinase
MGRRARAQGFVLGMGRDLAAETSGAVTKILDRGVEHRDVRPPNVLWNPEIRNVVLVDFERSQILKQVQVLQETSPNRKRKHFHLDSEASCVWALFLTELSSIPASASIGAIHMFKWFCSNSTHSSHHNNHFAHFSTATSIEACT